MSVPKVSVILPTLNRASLLPRAIASVLGQSVRDLELLVVDDGSDEDIDAVVSAFDDDRVKLIRHPQRRGPAAARNSGLAAARGDYIAFQDSDDEWRLDKLEQQLAQLEAAPADVAMVICQMVRYKPGNRLWLYPPPRVDRDLRHDTDRAIHRHAMAFTQTWLVRRTALQALDGFNERLKIWDDWELLLRISEAHGIQFGDQPLVVSYTTADSVSSNLPARASDLEEILARHGNSHDMAFVSRLHYLLARFRSLTGDLTGARRALYLALKERPGHAKAWLLGTLLLFGMRGVRWIPGAAEK